jgi:translation initiation factor 6 (eIF-6)
MPKYLCTVKATIYITKEVCDIIEIEAPDEVQAEEDAVTAARIMDNKTWLNHPEIDYNEFYEEIEFEIEDVEEKNAYN